MSSWELTTRCSTSATTGLAWRNLQRQELTTIVGKKILIHIVLSMQVSITLIATGFKRQDEPEGRASKVTLVEQLLGPPNLDVMTCSHICLQPKGGQQGENGRRPSSAEGSMVEIPEFLRRRGPSRFPRVYCPAMLLAPALHLYNMPHS